MTKVTAAIAVLLTGLVFVASADAKGPFDMEVSGRGLDNPILVPGPFTNEDVYPLTEAAEVEVASLARHEPYVIAFVVEHPETGDRLQFVQLNYYPRTDDTPAAFHDTSGDFIPSLFAWEATEELEQTLLDAGIGSGSDESASAAWYLIPAGLMGLVVVGGIGGRYLIRRVGNHE